MSRIRFILVGKSHSAEIDSLCEMYRERLLKYADTSIVYLKDKKLPDHPSKAQIDQALATEGDSILKSLSRTDQVIALDLRGRESTSEEFAAKLSTFLSSSPSIVFVIGSSYGMSDAVRKRANYLWKLSSLTFTHPLALLISMEQVYRGLKIARGEVYQK